MSRTRFSNLHPYPAMIANDLAQSIASRFVRPGMRLLDPFCGTGRTLFAADSVNATKVGVDVNSLALIIAEAKASSLDIPALEQLRKTMRPPSRVHAYDIEEGRKVRWFSKRASEELSQIVSWINRMELTRHQIVQLAALLSATTREVSFCRDHQWKLHRMPAKDRRVYRPSAWAVFLRRFDTFISEARIIPLSKGTYEFRRAGEQGLINALSPSLIRKRFDVVITSPPYGDSRTTVGYGGMSSMCLGVLRHIDGLEIPYMSAGQIDNLCLGGFRKDRIPSTVDALKYWPGKLVSQAGDRIATFLQDLKGTCHQVADVSADRATVIFVVARRSVGGRRLRLETFVSDMMKEHGFSLISCERRNLICKTSPLVVNARGAGNESRRVPTMRTEYVLALRR